MHAQAPPFRTLLLTDDESETSTSFMRPPKITLRMLPIGVHTYNFTALKILDAFINTAVFNIAYHFFSCREYAVRARDQHPPVFFEYSHVQYLVYIPSERIQKIIFFVS